jgi:hypothetical protein
MKRKKSGKKKGKKRAKNGKRRSGEDQNNIQNR